MFYWSFHPYFIKMRTRGIIAADIMHTLRGWLRPKLTTAYRVWVPPIWVPKLIKVIKKAPPDPPPPSFSSGGKGMSLLPNFGRNGGGPWQQKVYKQKWFSVTTKNLNWENLTKNLVTFKRWDGVIKAKKFQCYRGSLKNLIFMGKWGVHKKSKERRNYLKVGLGQKFNMGLGEKEGFIFLKGLIPQCTLCTQKNNSPL